MAVSKKRTRRAYTDEDKAKALVVLTANGGNKAMTAREIDIPLPTLRTWIREWEKEDVGPPASVTALMPVVQAEFLEKAERVQLQLIDKIEELIPEAGIKNLTPLATTLGILTDKIDKIRGVNVHRPEELRVVLPTAEEAAGFVSSFLEAALKQQQQREEDITDVEVIEEQPFGLLPAASDESE